MTPQTNIPIEKIEEIGTIALKIVESLNPKLSDAESAFFLAGFQECYKYMYIESNTNQSAPNEQTNIPTAELLKQQWGYAGKPKQWQQGFDSMLSEFTNAITELRQAYDQRIADLEQQVVEKDERMKQIVGKLKEVKCFSPRYKSDMGAWNKSADIQAIIAEFDNSTQGK